MYWCTLVFISFAFACACASKVSLNFTDVGINNDSNIHSGLRNANTQDTQTTNRTLERELDCDCGPHGNCFTMWKNKACSCFEGYAAKLVDSELMCETCDCGTLQITCTYKDYETKVCTCNYGSSPYKGYCYLCDCGTGSYRCIITEEGDRKCDCRPGFKESIFDCKDINECEKPSMNDCPAETDCFNTIGSYKCICKQGFHANYPSSKCEDIDECAEQLATCDSISEDCVNTYGSYQCFCKNNYIPDIMNRSCRWNGGNGGWRIGYIVLIIIIGIAIGGTIMFAKRRYFMQ